MGIVLTLMIVGCEPIVVAPSTPSGQFDPDELNFGVVPIEDVVTRATIFQAPSDADRVVRAVSFSPPLDAFGAFLSDGGTLNGTRLFAGGPVAIDVRFVPLVPGSHNTTMLIDGGDLVFELPIRAQARELRAPQLELNPSRIEFSSTMSSVSLEIRNIGEEVASLVSVEVESPFLIEFDEGLPQDIGVGQSLISTIEFRPEQSEGIFSSVAVFRLASGSDAQIELSGESRLPRQLMCPDGPVDFGAVPRGRTQQRTVVCMLPSPTWVLEDVRFDSPHFGGIGEPRFDSSKLMLDVEFIAHGPIGPTEATLEIMGHLEDSVSVDLSAHVEPARAGESDVALELTWEVGADLDLHLVRAGGQPFEVVDDCHFASKSPDWGKVGASDDNPFLDRDDLDGLGAERISLLYTSEPEFDVYVQYHEAAMALVSQPKTAMVRWELRNGVMDMLSQTLDRCGDWWHVGRIVVEPTLRFEVVNKVTRDFVSQASTQCQAL